MHQQDYAGNKNVFDWGRTTQDYAKYRPSPPLSFFKKLQALDVGLPGQKILDLGTGVGYIAIQLAKQHCQVVALDRSAEQIAAAQTLAIQAKLDIDFKVSSVEAMQLLDNSFNAVTAMQCWPYFQQDILIPKLRQVLLPNALLMIGNFDELPRKNEIAAATEQLILKYNPIWSQADWDGEIPPTLKWTTSDFKLKAMFYYDEEIKFTHESWRGRIRASQAIAASLSHERVLEFDQELAALLQKHAPENFNILHRLSTHIFEYQNMNIC